MDLLDAIIDRSADILERVGGEVDQVSHSIFEPEEGVQQPSYNDVLKTLGRKGDLASKVRESLVSMQRDVVSLSDHASYLTNKITFLLDAMLGVVNLQQNNIIKIFSVAAVVLMPPTLVASIYGMNFKHMRSWTGSVAIRSRCC